MKILVYGRNLESIRNKKQWGPKAGLSQWGEKRTNVGFLRIKKTRIAHRYL